MKPKNCLIFGGSGQIGRYLIRKLTKNNIELLWLHVTFIKKAIL